MKNPHFLLPLLLFFTFTPSSLSDNLEFLQCLSVNTKIKDQLQDILYTPENANYATILEAYVRNGRFITNSTRKPDIIVAPGLEIQVPEIILCANSAQVQLKPRSGGHDFEGLSYTNSAPFVILDLFRLNSIEIDLKEETAWVQAGATLGEVYYRIWEKSKVHGFPAGVCPTIGVGGHITGGGYGNLLRKYGLSADNVVDVRMVDALGRLLERPGMGEDLFWTIRGGGAASFGIVLAYKIQLVRVPPVVTVFNVSRTLEESAIDILHDWQYIAPKIDPNLFVRVYLKTVASKVQLGKQTVHASFVALFLGNAKDLVPLMTQNLPKLKLNISDCVETSWVKSTLFWGSYPINTPESILLNRMIGRPSAGKIKSDYVTTPIPKEGLVNIMSKLIEAKDITLQLNPYGGKMAEINETATPFPHRIGNLFKIQYLLFWGEALNDSLANQNLEKIRRFHEFMTPYVSKNPRRAFLNYRDLDVGTLKNGSNAYEEAKAYGTAYFNINFEKLVQQKTKIDPHNFFRNEQSIPTSISI